MFDRCREPTAPPPFSYFSGLRLNLRAALGAGDDDLSLARRNAADGFAVFTGEVFVVLVSMAGLGVSTLILHAPPPVDPFLVLTYSS